LSGTSQRLTLDFEDTKRKPAIQSL
jgi:hypothetical protein